MKALTLHGKGSMSYESASDPGIARSGFDAAMRERDIATGWETKLQSVYRKYHAGMHTRRTASQNGCTGFSRK